MGALAVPLPCRLDPPIGHAAAGRRGRDPSSQKGLGGAPEESGCLATGRWPGGYPALSAGEAARPQPTHPGLRRAAAPGPQAHPGEGGREEAASGLAPRKTWSRLWAPRAGLAPSLCPEARPGASPSPRLCAGRRRPLCPYGEWRTRRSAPATSRAFGEFREQQRRFWGVPGLQPPGKTRGWPFRSQTADSRQFPPRNLEPH